MGTSPGCFSFHIGPKSFHNRWILFEEQHCTRTLNMELDSQNLSIYSRPRTEIISSKLALEHRPINRLSSIAGPRDADG